MKEKAVRASSGWKSITLPVVGILLFFMAIGCAEVKLGKLPSRPPSARLRVFVKAITGEARGSLQTSHERFEQSVYMLADRYLSQSGHYEIVPIEEVRLIAGKEELAAWHWNRNDWELAVEVGRRLYAEYALIVEREPDEYYQKFLLINVDTKTKFEVESFESSFLLSASQEEWEQGYRDSFFKLYDEANEDLLATANRKSRAISSELAAARKEILALTGTPEKETKTDNPLKAKEPASRAKPSAADAGKDEKVAAIETRLAKLMEILARLEEMKKQFEEQSKNSELLNRELAEKEQREKVLLRRLEDSSKFAPVIVLASPRQDSRVEVNFVQLSGVVEDEKGLTQLEIYINDKPLSKGSDRGIRVATEANSKRLEFLERVSLQKGVNQLKVRAIDSDGLLTEKTVTVHYIEKLKNIWAVVIGINEYQQRCRHVLRSPGDAESDPGGKCGVLAESGCHADKDKKRIGN